MRCYVCGTSGSLISLAAHYDEDEINICPGCLGTQTSDDEEPTFDSYDDEEIL
jgi:ribosome-binding protein aMBF1 (putative translation factor)